MPSMRPSASGYHAHVANQACTTHAGIVLAAGSGTRVGNSRSKVYLPLAGRRIVTWSLELFQKIPGIGRLVLVVRNDDQELAEEVLDRELPGVPVDLVTGGETRHAEYRALLHLAMRSGRGRSMLSLSMMQPGRWRP
jgi:2-C-methyl-D-erythritol 4-phosphate cytidylyltransferase